MSLGGKVERSRPGEKGGLVASGSRAPGCLQQLRTFYSMAGLRWSQWTSARSPQAWVAWLCCSVPGQVFNIIIAFALPHFLPKDVRYRTIIPCTALIGPLMMLHGRALNEVFQDTTNGYRSFLQVNGLRAHIYWLETWSYHLGLSAGFAVWFTVLARLVPVFMKHTNSVLVFVAFTLAIQHYSLIGCFYGRFFLRSIETANAGGMITMLLNFVGISSCVWCVSASRMEWLHLIPTFGVNNMLASIQCLEADKVGFTFDTFFRSTCMSSPRCNGGEIVPPGVTMLNILWVNLILACLLYWLDQVVAPRDWGVARHPLFFLSGLQSCFGEQATKKRGDSYGTGRPPALRLHDVHKVYPTDDGKGHAALTNFNLEVHSSELFALLGHNGSGKTTMINIAVGLIAPTAGDGTVNGISVSEDTAEAQRQLALCPQQTKVFEEITVETNLEFFCTVRGMDRSMVGQQVFEVLRAVGLEKERHRLCSELSGGQSRRLWLAAALLGSRPLILLDEPSSGLDPASRRRLWGTLEWVRGLGSAVIFTTHYLDEADIAADRKAILSHGRVRAVGTSLELKQKYAVGYRLGLGLLAGSTASASWSALQELVLRHIPKATQERKKREAVDGGTDEAKAASFLLPFSDVDSIGPLLEEIDTRKQELGVREYDVQMSSLEDVYMKLAPRFSGTVDEDESLPTVVEETASAQPASGLAFSSTLDLESPKAACQDYPPPEIFRQMLSLVAVRLAVITDGGALTYVFLRIVLPVISISTLLTRSIIMMSPASWFHMATTFPMMLLAVLGPSVGQLNADATSKRKLMMLTHRMSPLAYTLGGFLADYVLLLPVILALPLLALISRTVYLSGPGLLLIFFTALTYPFHLSVWVSYLQSFVRHNKSSQTKDFMLITSGVLFSSLVPSVIVVILITQGMDNWPSKAHLLRKVPLVSGAFSLSLPTYSMPGVLILVLWQSFGAYYEEHDHTACYKMPCEISLSPWYFFTTQAAMPFFLAMVPTAMRARTLLLAAQSAALSQGDGAGEGTPPPEERDLPPKDEGVLEEEERLRRGGHGDIIAYRGLHYTYVAEESDAKVRAVRGVSLGLRHGECFGLLGPNGAGKTTTLACLTGELWPPTAGTVFFNGQDLSKVGFQSLYGKLGMCLQHDGHLWDCLSGLSHLYFYGRLKGIPEDRLEVEIDSTLERVRLKVKDAVRPVKEYSGGMKRRLSIAVALLGKPSVLFMDEPTAAVDVMVKRELWKVIKNRGAGKMVLLTSHQMEEVEMLCDRVAIQVLGRLRALGTVSHLRRRYGSGYQLELVSEAKPKGVVGEDADQDSADRVQELERFVRGHVHPSAKLLDSQVGRAVFQLEESEESGPVRLATVFKQVSAARAELGIKDYGLRQPTLEQVFVRFAQEQAEAEEAERARMGMPP